MNEGFVEGWMQYLETVSAQSSMVILEEIRDDLIESISTPVVGKGRSAIRSAPGDPPFRETGELIASISIEVTDNPEEGVGGRIVIAAVYAKALEYGHPSGYVAARPFVGPIIEKWDDLFRERFKQQLLIRL